MTLIAPNEMFQRILLNDSDEAVQWLMTQTINFAFCPCIRSECVAARSLCSFCYAHYSLCLNAVFIFYSREKMFQILMMILFKHDLLNWLYCNKSVVLWNFNINSQQFLEFLTVAHGPLQWLGGAKQYYKAGDKFSF